MPDLGMKGPFPLDQEHLRNQITRAWPGNYAVGYMKEGGGFVVRYVGRSDTDVKQALSEEPTDSSTWFKWCYAESAHEAFEHECRNYHDFGAGRGLENENHPVPPKGTNWHCPKCSR